MSTPSPYRCADRKPLVHALHRVAGQPRPTRDDAHLQALWLQGFASRHTRRAYARDVQAFLVLYYTSCRIAEACALQWRDVRDQDGDQLVATLYGKSGRTPSSRSLQPRAAFDIVRAAARRAGLQVPVSPHWLRHAHASHALDRGAKVNVQPSESSGHVLAHMPSVDAGPPVDRVKMQDEGGVNMKATWTMPRKSTMMLSKKL